MNKNFEDAKVGDKFYAINPRRGGQRFVTVRTVTVVGLTPSQIIVSDSGGYESRYRKRDGKSVAAVSTWETKPYLTTLDDSYAKKLLTSQLHRNRSARLVEAVQRFEADPTEETWQSVRERANMLAHVHGFPQFSNKEATTTD